MKIKPVVYGIVVITVFFGVILGFQAAGVWSTSGKVDSSGKSIQPSAADPTTIKGWMTFEQIVTTFNVPLADILAQFNLPASTPITTAIKDLESDTFETSALISWLQSRSVNSEVPVNTPDVIIATPTPPAFTKEVPDSLTLTATEHLAPDRTITGKTTFQELLDWGVTFESIQNSIGYEILIPGVIIKDFAVEKGLAFSDIKTKLQIEIDQLP